MFIKLVQNLKSFKKSPQLSLFSTKYSQAFSQSPQLKRRLTFSALLSGVSYYTFTQTRTQNDEQSLEDLFYEKILPADLQEGEKREIQLGPKEEDCVLLCKVGGKYYCVSNKCPHYGAPLGKGPLFDDKILCPWHNASFSVKDGAHEGGPIYNGLETFPVEVHGDKLKIRVEKSRFNVPRVLPMVTRDPNNKTEYVIVGGGPAGLSAAETLRQSGFTGKITIVSKENILPYDRTVLSKAVYFANGEKLAFRKEEFLKKYGIDILKDDEVYQINVEAKTLRTLKQGDIKWDKLLIATGGRPRRIQINGGDKEKILTLRDTNDLEKLKKKLEGAKNVVIVGASFIGLETASSIKDFLKDKINIQIVDSNEYPHQRVFGDKVGQAIQQMHEENGIKFHLKNGVQKIEGNKVHLNNGSVIDADLVLLGVGVEPNTQFINSVEKDFMGGIKTDTFLESSQKDIFAAGDVANYPYHYTGQRVRIEHINTSIYQGYIAALNMLGRNVPVQEIPFFWTRQWNKSLQFTGITNGFDDVYVQGDLKKLEFMAWYGVRGRVIGFASMNKGPVVMVVNEAMKQNVLPTMDEIKNGKFNLEDIKKRVEERGDNCKCQRMANCCGANTKSPTF